jgi:hypothetical protein
MKNPDETAYLELLAKLDAATAPDRELDLLIHLFVWPDDDIAKITYLPRGIDGREGYAWDIYQKSVIFEQRTADGRCPHNGGFPLPEFTSSIDDALKLLRKHYLWQLKQGIECTAIVWWLEKDWDDTGAPTAYSTTHPALALTKAILLARAVEDRLVTFPPQSCNQESS